MRVLMAEDDAVSAKLLETVLTKWGYETVVAHDGKQAWLALQAPDAPQLAVLDWMMPGIDGVEVCRRTRALDRAPRTYIIMLTAMERKEDLVTALDAGADDYLIKPFHHQELRARIQVGVCILELQVELADRVRELEEALANIKVLRGLMPICSYCKKVRDDQNYWQQVEQYIESHADVEFSHSVCPECYEKEIAPHLRDT
ncbi:MAG: response regulator transcription factor [Gemmatimonadota bacterium]|nr:response regulator transcription factor [Gemmatimonadota bacterium]